MDLEAIYCDMIVQKQVKFWILWLEGNHSGVYLVTSYASAVLLSASKHPFSPLTR